jgi:hypothetical protein
MSEPIVPKSADDAAELATLRRVNAELLAKSASRKAKVSELEVTVADLTGKLTASETAVHESLVTVPLRQLSEVISPVPSVWLETFSKHFKVTSKDGTLNILTNDGLPLNDSKGMPVKFERAAIALYLTETEPESERTKLFRMITVSSLASGASASHKGNGTSPSSSQPHRPGAQFGIGIR